MNKKELVAKIVEMTGLKKREVYSVLDAFVDVVRETVNNGGKVRLVGFATFRKKELAPRKVRDFKTGEFYYTEKKEILNVKPSKKFLIKK